MASRTAVPRSKAALKLSQNARTVLERRYLARDESGHLIETPEDLFRRVARNIAEAERSYMGADITPAAAGATVARWEASFLELLTSMRFLPNSPTLGNAGRPLQQLAACFVLPVEDSMAGIFETVKDTALIHQSGGGTGFSFSRLRPAGDIVQSTGGIASGPLSFMKVFDAATEAIKQGGTRRGANMAILDVHHPDIEAFINVKADMVTLTNFNISVAVDEAFMNAVETGAQYELINPRTGSTAGARSARAVFDQIVANAWQNGDPGLVFLDRINRDNPTPALGAIEATNPCGEQPLLPYESCNLGSINLAKFAKWATDKDVAEALTPSADPPALAAGVPESQGPSAPGAAIDWPALGETVRVAVRFLDDVIDMNAYPIPEIERVTKLTRKIGLGVMGWADLLFQLGVPYDSEEALALAGKVMAFIRERADLASEELAGERGVFPAWEDSRFGPHGANRRFRNSTRTTIAPTGTLSIIAGCSGGIEPAFALAFTRHHFLDQSRPSQPVRMSEVDPVFERAAKAGGFYSKALIHDLALGATLSECDEVPGAAKRVFVTAHEIAPEWHVRMQAAFQRYTDNAVSKTINFPRTATEADVAAAYLRAYREGCKGITIYRDGSRAGQVLSHGEQESVANEHVAEAFRLPPAAERGPAPGLSSPTEGDEGPLHRRHLPDERNSITHKFRVGEQEGFVTVGLFDDGTPGEIFVTISKEGSTIRGLMDSVAMLTSYALQYGVPLRTLVDKFRGVHFEPAGLTANPALPQASSLVDYIFRWLERKFLLPAAVAMPPLPVKKPRRASGRARTQGRAGSGAADPSDAATGLLCPDCGMQLVFAEGCLTCRACGYTKCG